MKNTKLIIVTILIVMYSSFIYANNEIVEKNGNTTKIKLLDEGKNNSEIKLFGTKNEDNAQLFGADPTETANYKYYTNSVNDYWQLLYKTYEGSTSSSYESGTISINNYNVAPNMNFSDSNQNKANVSTNSCIIKMTQDDDYYYFNISDLYYESPITNFDYSKTIGDDKYQTMNNGDLYLSNKPINNLAYTYHKDYFINTPFYDKTPYADSSSSGANQYTYTINENLSLTLNDITSSQGMKLSSTYDSGNKNTYTRNDTGSTNQNINNNFYMSYKFPFEDILNGKNGFYNINVALNRSGRYYNVSINGHSVYSNSSGYWAWSCFNSSIHAKALFQNGQQNFSLPQKLTYEPIINISHNQNKQKTFWNDKLSAKIMIKKSDINNFRYLNMYAPMAIHHNSNKTPYSFQQLTTTSSNQDVFKLTGGSQTYKSVHSEEAIDLMPYTYCEHNWIKKRIDNHNEHEYYCTKCEWTHREPHNFIYEYDGFTNNLCECGQNNKINHHYILQSNEINELDEIVDSNSDYIKYNNLDKKGYILDYFKKYEKQFINIENPEFSLSSTSIVNRYIESVATMSELSSNFSTTYEAVYKPIKYNIQFNMNNNKGLTIDNKTPDIYDLEYEKFYTLPNVFHPDYAFEGWTKTLNSDIVDILVGQEFSNLTDINNDTIILYPVFDEPNYKFIFHKENNLNLEIKQDIPTLKCYLNNNYILPNNIDILGYNFIGWTLNKNSSKIDFIPNQELYNYTFDNLIYNLYPVYEINKYTFIYSNNNILNLPLNDDIEYQEFNYGEKQNLKPHKKLSGYRFNGWSLVASSSNIDFLPEQEIFNYTTINNETITIYPVYEEMTFRLVYMTDIGTFNNGSNSITKDYKLYDIVDLEIPSVKQIEYTNNKGDIIKKEYYEFISYNDLDNNIFKTMNEIKHYIVDKDTINNILYLNANLAFKTWNKPSNSSGGSSGLIDSIKTDNAIKIEEIKNTKNDAEIVSVDTLTNNYKTANIKKIKKQKDIVLFLQEIYTDWKEQNNINDKRKFDIVDLIKAIYKDFSNNND